MMITFTSTSAEFYLEHAITKAQTMQLFGSLRHPVHALA